MGAAGLRKSAIGFHLHCMDEIGKLYRILDEEHRNVIANQIPIALFRVELHRKSPHVARSIDRAGTSRHGGEAREKRRFLPFALEDVGGCEVRKRLVRLEKTVGRRAARVNDTFRNTLVIEVKNLLTEVKSSSVVGPRGPTLREF